MRACVFAELVPIHSTLDFEAQLAAFSPAPAGVTKVIAATNAAESSLTLPDVDFVIDLGIEKAVFWNHHHGSSELRQVWVSKASATQRAGRTGRVRPGRVCRLYPHGLFDQLADHNACEMSRQPLEETVLQVCRRQQSTRCPSGVKAPHTLCCLTTRL